MTYSIRLAESEDLPRIAEIYAGARAFMTANGNPGQWGTNHPSQQQLAQDICSRVLYLLEDGQGIHGYAGARAFMTANGNPGQWGTNHPSQQQLAQDICSRVLYLLEDGQGIHGVFAFLLGEDPTYRVIYDGAWHYDLPYAL